MVVRCRLCPWCMTVRTESPSLALWLLKVHRWERHGGPRPEVVPERAGICWTCGQEFCGPHERCPRCQAPLYEGGLE